MANKLTSFVPETPEKGIKDISCCRKCIIIHTNRLWDIIEADPKKKKPLEERGMSRKKQLKKRLNTLKDERGGFCPLGKCPYELEHLMYQQKFEHQRKADTYSDISDDFNKMRDNFIREMAIQKGKDCDWLYIFFHNKTQVRIPVMPNFNLKSRA